MCKQEVKAVTRGQKDGPEYVREITVGNRGPRKAIFGNSLLAMKEVSHVGIDAFLLE